MRVLGVDPGTLNMGVGVVDSKDGNLALVYSGVLRPTRRDSLPRRLHHLYYKLLNIMQDLQPSAVAVEEPFVARDVRAAMTVGHAQAVALVAAAECGLSVSTYPPTQVKQSVTDYGGSSKAQVQAMVKTLLGITEESAQSPDESDALAVAICHIASDRVRQLEQQLWSPP